MAFGTVRTGSSDVFSLFQSFSTTCMRTHDATHSVNGRHFAAHLGKERHSDRSKTLEVLVLLVLWAAERRGWRWIGGFYHLPREDELQ